MKTDSPFKHEEFAMLKTSFVVASLSLALVGGALAEDAHHPDEKAQKPPATKSAPGAALERGGAGMMSMAPMQENMKRMQDEMAKIRATSDPKEKEHLMEDHLKTMEQCVSMMSGRASTGK